MATDTVERFTRRNAGPPRVLAAVVHWVVRSILCAAFWALTLLVVEVTDPAIILAGAAARPAGAGLDDWAGDRPAVGARPPASAVVGRPAGQRVLAADRAARSAVAVRGSRWAALQLKPWRSADPFIQASSMAKSFAPEHQETPPSDQQIGGKVALMLVFAFASVALVVIDGGTPGPGYIGRTRGFLGMLLIILSVLAALLGRGRRDAERLQYALLGGGSVLIAGHLLRWL
jgi:hypothetical protein